jgi:hypothetical protein
VDDDEFYEPLKMEDRFTIASVLGFAVAAGLLSLMFIIL